ncbi:MAG: (Fe-S)-binding protein [Eubacteriales bacterium]
MVAKREIPPVLEILCENIVKSNNPLALNEKDLSSWAKGLNLPLKGDTLFYTGGEYQLLPYIDSLVKTITYINPNGNFFSLVMGARKIVNMTGIHAEKIYASILAKDKKRYNLINYKAVYILQKLGYDLCYNGKEEIYSGALLHELGFWKELKSYAPKVADYVRKTEAKTVVCISPHAAEMFKLILPQITDFPDVKVRTFVEMVCERKELLPKLNYNKPVVIHDSCRLARELGIHEEIRQILDSLGVKYIEALRNREWTTCCGGPSKMLFPDISKIVSGRRVTELADTGADTALISCPYCLSALESGKHYESRNIEMEDLIEFIYRGYES